jgi:hypothetical protein
MAGAGSGRAQERGRRYVGEFDELLSAFLQLEATLPVILRVVIERFFLRSICNLPRQMTTNLAKADAVEQKSGLGIGCLSPVASSPLSDLSITGLTTGRRRKYKYESAENDNSVPQKSGQLLSALCKYERQSKRQKGYEQNSNSNVSDGGGDFFGARDSAAY